MVDLSEAGVRLRDYRPEPTPGVEVIQRRRDRRRRRRRTRAGFAALALMLAVSFAVSLAVAPRNTVTSDGSDQSSSIGIASATAAQLAVGRWSTMPPAPIAPRLEPSLVWTGKELIVWGGYGVNRSGPAPIYGDGAAYNPTTERWRILPAAPITARNGQTAVWTGSEMVVWGGYDAEGVESFHVTSDGAAYDPTKNKWRVLPPAPLSPRTRALGVWTGTGVLVLGGISGDVTSMNRSYLDGAVYHPASNAWQHIAAPTPPSDHVMLWWMTLRSGGELLAWSKWFIQPTSPGAPVVAGGVDLFAYNDHSRQWRLIPSGAALIQGVLQAVWTGQYAIVRGTTDVCLLCRTPQPEETALYSPAHNTWTGVAPDPLAPFDPLAVWTGAALLSIDVSGSGEITHLGKSTAYDPATRQWLTVPSAPFGCDALAPPFEGAVWTGRKVLLYCQSSSSTVQAAAVGLIFTPGP